MLDPLTALGLAGNIITFVDYSTKVLSRGRELYESATGSTEENEELESLTRNLKDLVDRTRRKPSVVPQQSISSISITREKVLDGLSQQCNQVAGELLKILNSIKVKGDGRTRKSVIQAVRTLWKQDQIDSLHGRLDRISKQLIDAMNMDQLDEINRRLREIAVENTRLEVNRSPEIDQLRQDFNSAVEEIKADIQEEHLADAWLVLSDTARRGQDYFAEQVILQSLRFSSIDSRHESISKEHSQTFSWIFDETASIKFVEWLKNEDGFYWVSGKPGSGKSTLMKFVAEHQKTRDHLYEWAGGKKLIIAKFYFWSASTHRSQKSQQGLLRSMLYQILRQCPKLIQVAYLEQWIAMTSDGKILRESRNQLLSVPALLNALRTISTATASDTNFCFFVDGLDEYEGRPSDIIELVNILKSFENIKACVSSRPWNEFEDHFGRDSPWKLYMHELTRNDIHLYVEDTLGENQKFQQLRKDDPQCPDFVWNIVSDADGVFLWVFLVTRSLLDGLTNSDRIKDLQQRVDETPKDLEDYFTAILFSTENRYRTQTARTFTIAVNAIYELPLMAYWVIDQEDTNYMRQLPVETPSVDILTSRVEKMERRLKSLTKGLLETQETVQVAIGANRDFNDQPIEDYLLFEFKVNFLHRTVKDYLQTRGAQLMLETWSDDNFNADLEICRAFGSLAKMASRTFFQKIDEMWYGHVFAFFMHALRIDQNPLCSAEIADILDELQRALLPALRSSKPDLERSYMSFVLNAEPQKEGVHPDLAMISACIGFGLSNYVTNKFRNEPQLCHRVANHFPSLLWSTRPGLSKLGPEGSFIEANAPSEAAMVELILTHGVDPNTSFGGQSEWRLYLEDLALWREDIRKANKGVFDCIKVMLRYGANFQQQCTIPHPQARHGTIYPPQTRHARADDIFKDWLDSDQFSVLQDIVKRRERKSKKSKIVSKTLRHVQSWIKSRK
jgi:hypothetical protein